MFKSVSWFSGGMEGDVWTESVKIMLASEWDWIYYGGGGAENHYVESFKPEDNDETRLDSRRIYAFGWARDRNKEKTD